MVDSEYYVRCQYEPGLFNDECAISLHSFTGHTMPMLYVMKKNVVLINDRECLLRVQHVHVEGPVAHVLINNCSDPGLSPATVHIEDILEYPV
jgi:hypothetical protein